jgi:hypothetical protein
MRGSSEMIVEEVAVTTGLLLVAARGRERAAECPKCGTASGRVHSRYSRRLADAAVGGGHVEICLAVRRFICRNPGWEQKIFSEQVSGLTALRAEDAAAGRRARGHRGLANNRCGSRTPRSTEPGHDKHTPPCDKDTTDSWKEQLA